MDTKHKYVVEIPIELEPVDKNFNVILEYDVDNQVGSYTIKYRDSVIDKIVCDEEFSDDDFISYLTRKPDSRDFDRIVNATYEACMDIVEDAYFRTPSALRSAIEIDCKLKEANDIVWYIESFINPEEISPNRAEILNMSRARIEELYPEVASVDIDKHIETVDSFDYGYWSGIRHAMRWLRGLDFLD